MTLDELQRMFPNASISCLRANFQVDDPGQAPVVEHGPRPVALAAVPAKEESSERVLVRIVSVRQHLIDPDNLCEKWHLDCLRYICAIQGDEPDKITLETTQRKVKNGEGEHTEITVYRL